MKRIAVIEDNPDNQLLIRTLLAGLYEVTGYETGPSALEAFQAWKPDLVLLDISLPEMDGTQVLAHIREDPGFRFVPVIALTAHAMDGDREKFMAAGFDDYVTKPILDENDLLGAIERLLN